MTFLTTDSLPAERQAGCFWASSFRTAGGVIENGATVHGAPSFSSEGITLDGTNDYLEYTGIDSSFSLKDFSVVIWFKPDFNYTDNNIYQFFDTTSSERVTMFKHKSDSGAVLGLTIDGVSVFACSNAIYGPLWRQNEWNCLVVTCEHGAYDTDCYFNGTQIISNDTTAYNLTYPTELYIGAKWSGSNLFDGTIGSVKFFSRKLSGSEAIQYSSGIIWDYKQSYVVNLPMRFQEHDPENTRTLDISGYDNHAILGAATAEPIKNTTQVGYNFDGVDDFMTITDDASITFGDGTTDSPFSLCFWMRADTAVNFRAMEKRDVSGDKEYALTIAGNTRIYWTANDLSTGGSIGRSGTIDMDIYDGQWVHMCGTYDGSSTSAGFKFFVNGVRKDSFNNEVPGYIAMENTGVDLTLGEYVAFADGSMAYVKVASRELNPLQVMDIYYTEKDLLNTP